jgi:ABC-2 type transport system permease protein
MSTFMLELRLVLHSRLAAWALAALFLLSCLSVLSGLHAVGAQREALARIQAAHAEDYAAVVAREQARGDAGYAGYYTFHLTWDPPPPLAFMAFGQRDIQPQALRIRLLGLHSQLYESEAFNPELALPGRFDFAFVLVYLLPLFVIAFMHDWVGGERESGRLRLLVSLPMPPSRLWWRRAVLRYLLLLAAVLPPFLVGAIAAGAAFLPAAGVSLVAALYTAWWMALAMWVGARARSSAGAAAILLGLFVVLTLLLPAAINAAVNRLVPVAKGVELAMAQREEVHQGWDQPKAAVFARFFRTHPEWSDTPPVTGRFHWKWYYAMHQAGDDAVADKVAQYRSSMAEREAWTARAGWLLPAAGVQLLLHRLADTDLQAQLAYRDRIAAFHGRLRQYFYPFLFMERRFGAQEYASLPAFLPRQPSGSMQWDLLAALLLATLAVGAGASAAIGSIRPLDDTDP